MKKENNFWKTSKIQHLIYRVILITLFTSSISYAELVKPNNGIEPFLVVQIQLRSLKQNDNPKKDNGIEQTWEFAHPNNKKNTGNNTFYVSNEYELNSTVEINNNTYGYFSNYNGIFQRYYTWWYNT